MFRQHLAPELVFRKDGRIHVPPKPLLGSLYRGYHVAERHVADDEQINVTGGMKLTARGRTEDKRRAHPVGERHERLAEDIHESYRLCKEPLELRKNGCLLVCLEVHLLAANLAAHQARGR